MKMGGGLSFSFTRGVVAVVGLLVFSSVLDLHSEDLQLINGTVYKGVTVTKTEPDGLRIIHSDGGGKVLFTDLPEEIQKKYHYDPSAAKKYTEEQESKRQAALNKLLQQSPPTTSPTQTEAEKKNEPQTAEFNDKIYPLLKGKLDYFDGTKVRPFDEAKLAKVRYYAIYYTSSCTAFTPELVSFYDEFKSSHPAFEIIHVSLCKSEEEMTDYLKRMSIIWPVFRFSEIPRSPEGYFIMKGIMKYQVGLGSPYLTLIDASTGSIIADSNQDGQYVGPRKVLPAIRAALK